MTAFLVGCISFIISIIAFFYFSTTSDKRSEIDNYFIIRYCATFVFSSVVAICLSIWSMLA